MEVIIRGKKTTFNKDVVSKLNYKEFEELCLNMPSFINLPVKERKSKIKELYGNYFSNAKKIQEFKSGSDLHGNDVKSDGGGIRTEQSANDGGENLKGKEDKAKVFDKKLRKPKKETKF